MGMLGRLLGLEQKAGPSGLSSAPMTSAQATGPWRPIIGEAFAGAWQRNVVVEQTAVLAFHAVFSCLTLIASDIAKLRVKLVAQSSAGIWSETTNAAYSPVLRKPNGFQTRIQFWESYFLSKLTRGNTYVLKQRDGRGVVTALYVLDPTRCRPMVAPDGAVFYELDADNLADVGAMVVPAREIIHDRFNCLFHPLVGISPIYACGLAATQGLRIQEDSATFFGNNSRPGGVLTMPGVMTQEAADALKQQWRENYGGRNSGKVAVLGGGLKYEAMSISPKDADVVQQLKWTAEVVCSTFHVPPYKLGIGTLPTNSNVESLNLEYYTQCLQTHIESAELCLDEGLGVGEAMGIGTEFDLDGLLRMDTGALIESIGEAVGAGVMSPNEGRAKINLPPVAGGETPYLQQQNFSLHALSKRDAQAPAPAPASASSTPAASPDAGGGSDGSDAAAAAKALVFAARYEKRFAEALT